MLKDDPQSHMDVQERWMSKLYWSESDQYGYLMILASRYPCVIRTEKIKHYLKMKVVNIGVRQKEERELLLLLRQKEK